MLMMGRPSLHTAPRGAVVRSFIQEIKACAAILTCRACNDSPMLKDGLGEIPLMRLARDRTSVINRPNSLVSVPGRLQTAQSLTQYVKFRSRVDDITIY